MNSASLRYFDAHTHVHFVAFDEDREAVFARAKEAGVGMLLVGTQKDTSAAAVAAAETHEGVWAAVGLHPIHTTKSFHDKKELGGDGSTPAGGFTSRGEDFSAAAYEALARHPKVVAIGECGLDYYRLDEGTKERQRDTFIAQIELANRVGKPLMLHIRDAYGDALQILKAHAKVHGNVHFFAGDWDIARQFLDLGFTLSFTGVITFTHDYDEVVKNAPLSMLLSETDAPYVAPVPFRGQRNEPVHVQEVVKAIAAIRGEEGGRVLGALFENARRAFNLAAV